MMLIHPCKIFLLVLAAKCSNAYFPSCECTDFVNDAGFGNCTGFSKFSFHGSLIACFVQLPSSCNDLINSTAYPGKQISVQACQERKKSEIEEYNLVESMVNDEARLPEADGNCPENLIVRSEGPAKNWKTKLGKYKLHDYDSAGNAVYTHSPNNGYLLYRVKGSKPIWMIGNKVGVDFGWIGNPNCKSKCPNDCPSKTWKYWKGKTGGKGSWYSDTKLEIKEKISQENFNSDFNVMLNDQPVTAPATDGYRRDETKCCEKMLIGPQGITTSNYPLISGIYERVPSRESKFDSEYIHSDRYGLASRLLLNADENQWKIFQLDHDGNNMIMRSAAKCNSTCPDQCFNRWHYYDSNYKHINDPDLNITCISEKGLLENGNSAVDVMINDQPITNDDTKKGSKETWKSFGPGMRPCDQNKNRGPEGVDLVGGHTLSLIECKDMCSRHPSCNAIAWRSSDHRCHLKKKESTCTDKPCQWNHRWGKDSEWNWYWISCEDSYPDYCDYQDCADPKISEACKTKCSKNN